MIRDQLQQLADGLDRLNESGNVRFDGERFLSELRVMARQVIEQADQASTAAAQAQPAPVDVRLAELTEQVKTVAEQGAAVADLVNQLAKLAGDLQAASVKG
jgi:glycine cleavage system aminomethyltransferase T